MRKTILLLLITAFAVVAKAQEWQDLPITGWVHEWRSMSVQTDASVQPDNNGVYKVYVRSEEQGLAAGNLNVDSNSGGIAEWDTQFFITLGNNNALSKGDVIKVSFDGKADVAAIVNTQSHAAPGEYLYWQCLGSFDFTSNWNSFETETTVLEIANGMYSIAFDLSDGQENFFYFRNISVKVKRLNPSGNWTNIILNGDMEGTDNRCFYTKNAGDGDAILSTIVNGIGKNGSRGVMVQSADNPANDWDAEFWIRLPQVVPAGTPIRVSFDYRATNEGSVSTQCHQEPGAYIHWACIGSPTFTSNWQTWEYEGTVPSECDGKNFHSIAFNLSNNHIATKFYFDNIKVEIPAEAVTDFDFPEIVEPDPSPIITFADANVKAICVQNWDTNGDGELSFAEAAVVTNLGRIFTGNNTIKSFDELQYFTGLTFIENYAFDHCSGLNSITIPNSVKNIYCEAFRSCSSLISITIPKSVVYICNNAFRNCI